MFFFSFKLGQLMAMAHRGCAVQIMSRSAFNYLAGMKQMDIIVYIDEIPEPEVKEI